MNILTRGYGAFQKILTFGYGLAQQGVAVTSRIVRPRRTSWQKYMLTATAGVRHTAQSVMDAVAAIKAGSRDTLTGMAGIRVTHTGKLDVYASIAATSRQSYPGKATLTHKRLIDVLEAI
jgi:hypothetical protein